LGDLSGEFFDFYAIELVDVDEDDGTDGELTLVRVLEYLAEHVEFEQPHFAVCDDEEVSAAAGGIEDANGAELLVEVAEAPGVAADSIELGAKRVEEQRLKRLEDVGFASVMLAEIAAGFLILDGLEECAEDCGRDARPIEGAALQDYFPHPAVERSKGYELFEELAVNVAECGKVFVEVALAVVFRGVKDLKELREEGTEVGTVFGGALLDPFAELLTLEDGIVFREETEEDANEEEFEGMTFVAGGLEEVVELAEFFGGLDVDGVLLAKCVRLVASDETEAADVLVKLFEGKLDWVFVGIEVVEADATEVGDDDVAREVPFFEAVEVIGGLVECAVEVETSRFVFNKKDALPEEVDETAFAVGLYYGLFEGRNTAAVDAKHMEEAVPKRFCF
jgi:hypothetical protein